MGVAKNSAEKNDISRKWFTAIAESYLHSGQSIFMWLILKITQWSSISIRAILDMAEVYMLPMSQYHRDNGRHQHNHYFA